jgi:hypothetical protein
MTTCLEVGMLADKQALRRADVEQLLRVGKRFVPQELKGWPAQPRRSN